jgi:sulfoxide reductase heme-binding subunit YedZ
MTWSAARASGIVAYLLLTVIVLVGLTLSGRVRLAWPRFAVEDVHRFGGLLVGVFVWLHVLTVMFELSLRQVILPFTSTFWNSLGVVSAELLLALAVTNKLRRRLPHRVWRNLHRLNLVVWIAASAHGIGSGTDSTSPWMLALYLLSIGAVTVAAVSRFALRPLPGNPAPRARV